MTGMDYTVLMAYIVGVFAIGGFFGSKVKSSKDMFAAGGQSPWWVSGLSGFMTMFSAGTFVVWGGIAYKYGIVAISINMCYGVAGLLVGFFVAGKWRTMGVKTPAEYIRLRFGKKAINFYTWTMLVYRMIGVAVALYSLAVLLTALMPLSEGNFLRDSESGNLSLNWAVILFGAFMIFYTMAGGLWSVLMADVLQFIVLNLAVIFVVPLCFMHMGGVSGFIESVPGSFFAPVNNEFTWFFLAGWCAIHFFMVGAEWAFVQRFICVPTPRDSQKAAWMFGVLYVISPWLWMLPPMLYKGMNAEANPEEAYILACQTVLPKGMLGMVLAAMVSATASMVSAQLNVFAGVLTSDFYCRIFKPEAVERQLVNVGRIMTILLGAVLVTIAILIPYLGGAEKVILSITSLIVGPLLAPSIWGLFSKRINTSAVWFTGGICFVLGALYRFGFSQNGWFNGIEGFDSVVQFCQANNRNIEIFLGVLLPVLILTYFELTVATKSRGYEKVAEKIKEEIIVKAPVVSELPALVVACSVGFFGIIMTILAIVNPDQWKIIAVFASVLYLIMIVFWYSYFSRKKALAKLGRAENDI
jgi:solute:Na+ symporter, SSS family